MLTETFNSIVLGLIKDNIKEFSLKVDGVEVKKEINSINLTDKTIKVTLLLDSNIVGKVTEIKLLDYNEKAMFESKAVYNKSDADGVYIAFSINDIVEVIK